MADCLNLLHFHLGSQITNIRQIKGAVNEAVRVYVGPGARRRRAADTWTSAAAWASITTARRPISNRASTTRCRNTPTTSSTTSRTSATKSSVPHPDHRHRERPRHRRVSQRAGVQRPGRVRNGRGGRAAGAAAGRRAAADRPAGNLPRPDRQEPARELSRRAAGARPGAESVQPRLSVARAALHRGESLLGDLPQDPEAGAASSTTSPKSWRASTPCSPTPTSATSRCSRACPTAGRSSSSSRSCRSTAWRSSPRATPCWATSPAIPTARWTQFIDRRDVKRTLPLHPFNGGDYYLGAFLLGAYQEILGDLHNLFGDTNAVHVRLGPDRRSDSRFGDQGRHRPRGAELRAVQRPTRW